jgi:hypothetical protein
VFGKYVRGCSSGVFNLFEGTEDDHGKSQFYGQYLSESQTMDLLNIKEKFFLTHCDVPYLGFICIE